MISMLLFPTAIQFLQAVMAAKTAKGLSKERV